MDANPFESPQALELQATPLQSRWLKPMMVVSLVIHPTAFVLYTMLICGCHFHWPALAVALVPVAWGFCTLFLYRSQAERLLSYGNVVLAVGWLWLDWGANTNFYFR